MKLMRPTIPWLVIALIFLAWRSYQNTASIQRHSNPLLVFTVVVGSDVPKIKHENDDDDARVSLEEHTVPSTFSKVLHLTPQQESDPSIEKELLALGLHSKRDWTTSQETVMKESSFEVIPRAFVPWNVTQYPFPCFHPTNGDESLHWTNKKLVLRTFTPTGLLFVKLLKCASSTSVSVHLRIARNYYAESITRNTAYTHNNVDKVISQPPNVSVLNVSTPPWELCQTRHLHGFAGPRGLRFRQRDTTRSFLWSMVREPVARYLSEFFHFDVSRRHTAATPANVRRFLRRGPHANQHMLAWLSLSGHEYNSKRRRIEPNSTVASDAGENANDWNRNRVAQIQQERKKATIEAIQEIINEYNFLGVAERFDESIVVLGMLLHRPLADILHISVKTAGNYDDGEFENRCVAIQPTVVPAAIQQFLKTDSDWLSYIEAEQVLYSAINDSLDLTIERLGRRRVEERLTLLRQAQAMVAEICRDAVIMPCTINGERIPANETDCMQGDMGCGFACLDHVADVLKLW